MQLWDPGGTLSCALPHAEMERDVMQVHKDNPQVVLVPLTLSSTQRILMGALRGQHSLWAAGVRQEAKSSCEGTIEWGLLFWHRLQLLPRGNSARGGLSEEARPSEANGWLPGRREGWVPRKVSWGITSLDNLG